MWWTSYRARDVFFQRKLPFKASFQRFLVEVHISNHGSFAGRFSECEAALHRPLLKAADP